MIELDLPALEGLVATLGWTLLHFLWQGAVIGVLFGVSLAAAGNASAQTRYRLAFFFLLLLAALPVATFLWLNPNSAATVISAETIVESAPLLSVSIGAPTLDWQTFVHPWLPWAVLVWAVGVALMTGRLLLEWRNVRLLTRVDVSPLTPAWQQRVQRLIVALGVRSAVRAMQSARVHVPMVVGWLRPVILVPVSAISGLTTWQLELIVMHELAHVRRYDHLVNLLQVVIETLLFYHPVVRWVSRVMREEREHCCDDLVVSRSGDALAYARALTELAGVQTLSLQTSVASDGGQLLARIRRLVGVRRPPRVAAHWSIGAMLATVAVSVSGLLQPLGVNSREADEPPVAAAPANAPSIEGLALDGPGLAFSQPEVQIPEPQVPLSIGVFAIESSGRTPMPVPEVSRSTLQTGSTPVVEDPNTREPADSRAAVAATDSPQATGAAPEVTGAQAVGNDSEATSPTESLLVTAPQAAAGSVVDRARMAAVDRVAQENGVKLVWLNPPVLQDAGGAAPLMPSADASELADDAQARAIAVLQPQPEFPDRARIDSIEGWVTVSYVIGRDGRVSDVAIVAAQPRNVFEGAVRKAVRSWRFQPVTVDGRPVEQKKTQTIRFSLSDGQPSEEMCLASTGSRICRAPTR
ncbi:MAG TPA: TonB family protein [Steroidobacteraceae bacterium]|nr:TonB family protein [Steroidobacteraceae bacterium]